MNITDKMDKYLGEIGKPDLGKMIPQYFKRIEKDIKDAKKAYAKGDQKDAYQTLAIMQKVLDNLVKSLGIGND